MKNCRTHRPHPLTDGISSGIAAFSDASDNGKLILRTVANDHSIPMEPERFADAHERFPHRQRRDGFYGRRRVHRDPSGMWKVDLNPGTINALEDRDSASKA